MNVFQETKRDLVFKTYQMDLQAIIRRAEMNELTAKEAIIQAASLAIDASEKLYRLNLA